MKTHLLAIDQGTTSTRVIIFDLKGNPIAHHQIELTQYFPQADWIEHDPNEIWDATQTCIKEALTKASLTAKNIISIGISNQRETTIIWNKKTGKPIYRAIVWQDGRTSKWCQQQAEDKTLVDYIQKNTGLLIDPYFSASKIVWLLDNTDGARTAADNGELLFGTIDTFLLWKLTKGRIHATDATNASRTLLFNIKNQHWDNSLLEKFNIPASLLPNVCDTAFNYGDTELFGHPIPIHALVGDQQAALAGNACFKKGMIKSTYGTGCFALLNTGTDFVLSKNKLLTTVAYRLDGQTTYGLEGSIFVAGAALQWLRDALHFFRDAKDTEEIVAKTKSNHGVYLVPAFTGLGAPHWDPQARGALLGLTRSTRIEHIVRAALEAVCYQTRDLLNAMQEDGADIKSLRADGGMAANNWLLQFLSDILNLEIQKPRCIETSALGAAFFAGLGAGIYASLDDIAHCWQMDKAFQPCMESELRDSLYRGWGQAIRTASASTRQC